MGIHTHINRWLIKIQKHVDIQQFDRIRFTILNSMLTKSKIVCWNFFNFKFHIGCIFVVMNL